MDALIMAAGRGSRLGGLAEDRPKSLIDLGGITPLEQQLDLLIARGVSRALLVTGYRRELLQEAAERQAAGRIGLEFIFNPFWSVTNVLGSAWFFSRLHRHVPASPVRSARDGAAAVAAALVAGAASLGFGLGAVALLPGRAALPAVALGLALALLGYAAAVLGVAPTPAGLRRALTYTRRPTSASPPGRRGRA